MEALWDHRNSRIAERILQRSENCRKVITEVRELQEGGTEVITEVRELQEGYHRGLKVAVGDRHIRDPKVAVRGRVLSQRSES